MKEAKAQQMMERLESDYAGFGLNLSVREHFGTFGVSYYGPLTGYETRMIFGEEDLADLEEEFPQLKEFRLFKKQAETWAKKLITDADTSRYTFTRILSEIFEKREDSFKKDCPECAMRFPGQDANRIHPDAEKCFHCQMDEEREEGVRCTKCNKKFPENPENPEGWECASHKEEFLQV